MAEDHEHETDALGVAYIQFFAPFPTKLTPPGVLPSSDHIHLAFAGRSQPDKNRAQWAWLAARLGVELV